MIHVQLARVIFRRNLKDHELEGGTKALVPLGAGRHLAAHHSDAGSSIDWADDLCQVQCAVWSEEGVVTRKKESLPPINYMIIQQNAREKQCMQFGMDHKHCLQRQPDTSRSTRPHLGCVCHAENKHNELEQRCVSTNAAASILAETVLAEALASPRVEAGHHDTCDAEGCDGSYRGVQQDHQR